VYGGPQSDGTFMEPTRASQTAIDTAHIRALDHELLRPSILGDWLAAALLRPEERETRETRAIAGVTQHWPKLTGRPRDELLRAALVRHASVVSLVLSRARYGEERLLDAVRRGVSQYVLVGAGLDTFAPRHPELLDSLRVFEIDHPQSQADKRRRLQDAGIDPPGNLHFGACDFETESIEDVLTRLPYASDSPAVFASMGVSMYLSREALDTTLRSIGASAAPGGEVIFDYLDARAMETFGDVEGVRSNIEHVRRLGEPVRSAMDAQSVSEDMGRLGFEVVRDLGPDQLDGLYFSGRLDDLRASDVGRIAHLRKISVE
jgi:methyltransferase (TIGR00027 family)